MEGGSTSLRKAKAAEHKGIRVLVPVPIHKPVEARDVGCPTGVHVGGMIGRLKSERAKEEKRRKKATDAEKSGRMTDENGAKSDCKEWRWASETKKEIKGDGGGKVDDQSAENSPTSFTIYLGEVTMATGADQALSATCRLGPEEKKTNVVEEAARTRWTIQMTCRISPTLMRRSSMSMQVLPRHSPPRCCL
jgi:hypothetical protein